VLLISLFCDAVLCLACVLCGSYCASLVLCAELLLVCCLFTVTLSPFAGSGLLYGFARYGYC
jgi:hypothetical protein